MNLWNLHLLPLPLPPPRRRMRRWGEGEKIRGVLQAGVARLQAPTRKVPLPRARGGKGTGDRGQELILNLQQSLENLPFFSQWLNSYHVSHNL